MPRTVTDGCATLVHYSASYLEPSLAGDNSSPAANAGDPALPLVHDGTGPLGRNEKRDAD